MPTYLNLGYFLLTPKAITHDPTLKIQREVQKTTLVTRRTESGSLDAQVVSLWQWVACALVLG